MGFSSSRKIIPRMNKSPRPESPGLLSRRVSRGTRNARALRLLWTASLGPATRRLAGRNPRRTFCRAVVQTVCPRGGTGPGHGKRLKKQRLRARRCASICCCVAGSTRERTSRARDSARVRRCRAGDCDIRDRACARSWKGRSGQGLVARASAAGRCRFSCLTWRVCARVFGS